MLLFDLNRWCITIFQPKKNQLNTFTRFFPFFSTKKPQPLLDIKKVATLLLSRWPDLTGTIIILFPCDPNILSFQTSSDPPSPLNLVNMLEMIKQTIIQSWHKTGTADIQTQTIMFLNFMAPSNFLLPIALKKVVRGYPSKAAPLGSALFAKNLGSLWYLSLKKCQN